MVGFDLETALKQFDEPAPQTGGGCGSCGSGQSGGGKCGNGLEKIYPTTAARFGYMKHIGEFTHAQNMKFTCGAKVVLQTKRGLEIGEQVSLTCSGCDKSVTREQMKAYAAASGGDAVIFSAGRIVREATMSDLSDYARLQGEVTTRRSLCRSLARKYRLPMKIVECEILFGGERAIFYFMSEERVDFRPLVKELADELQTRIEMRQIGARDEARLMADYETCGREVCCKVFLKTLKPVSMKMAKLQKSTIDPSKVSGRCGRLKCCLRYEHTSYEELDRTLPRVGARVRSTHGDGVVINRQILTQLVQIRSEDNQVTTVVVEDLLPPLAPGEVAAPLPTKRAESDRSSGPGDRSGSKVDSEGRAERSRSRRSRGGSRAPQRKKETDDRTKAAGEGQGTSGTAPTVTGTDGKAASGDGSAAGTQSGGRRSGRSRRRRRGRGPGRPGGEASPKKEGS